MSAESTTNYDKLAENIEDGVVSAKELLDAFYNYFGSYTLDTEEFTNFLANEGLIEEDESDD